MSSAKSSFFPFWTSFPLSAIYPPLFSRPVHPDSKNSGRERERERGESRRRVASEREERRPPRKGECLLISKPKKTRRRPGSNKKTDGVSGASGSVGGSVGRSGLARKGRPQYSEEGDADASQRKRSASVSQSVRQGLVLSGEGVAADASVPPDPVGVRRVDLFPVT